MMESIDKVKVRFVADEPCVYFVKNAVYDAYHPIDDHQKRWWAIYIEEDDDPGEYAFPVEWFEVVR